MFCSLRPRFFGVTPEGHVKFLEFDNLLPLTLTDDFKPFPPKVGVLRVRNGRMFGGHACTGKAACPLHCTQMASAMSEGFCPGDNSTCPGLGVKASMIAFGNMLLKDFVDKPRLPIMGNLIGDLTQMEEELRPSHQVRVVPHGAECPLPPLQVIGNILALWYSCPRSLW